MGTLSVTLSGGECMLHPDFIPILKHARKNDFIISVLSNLTLLTDEITATLKEVDVAQVQVSLYSMKAHEHDKITAYPGSHSKTLSAIVKLYEADVPVQISCPVMKTNHHSYGDVLRWAYDHKMKAYTDFIMMARSDYSTSNLDERITIDESRGLIAEMLKFDEDYRTNLDIEQKPRDIENEKELPICGVGVDNICLAANGNYYPCSGWQGMTVGNAFDSTLK